VLTPRDRSGVRTIIIVCVCVWVCMQACMRTYLMTRPAEMGRWAQTVHTLSLSVTL